MILAQLNIFIQFAFLFFVLVSLRLRLMGKIKAHGVMMIGALVVYLVMFVSMLTVFASDPMFTTHPQVTLASPLLTAAFGGHLFLALLSFGAGVWLVALWFQRRDYMVRSRIPAIVTEISWLLAFAVGLGLFIALNI
jgi:hypothetical protein